MTQQSEALRLADRLDTYATGDSHQQDIEQAAVELRRLDAALQSPQRTSQEEIIRMAREAGPLISTPFDVWCERFATLVRADEREACALVCDELHPGLATKRAAEIIRART